MVGASSDWTTRSPSRRNVPYHVVTTDLAIAPELPRAASRAA